MKQTETNRSIAVTYDTLGRDFLEMVLRVVMVSTVEDKKKKNAIKRNATLKVGSVSGVIPQVAMLRRWGAVAPGLKAVVRV